MSVAQMWFGRSMTTPRRRDLVLRMRLAGVGLRSHGPQAKFPHDVSDAPSTDQDAVTLEHLLQAPAAVHRVLGEAFIQSLQQVELLARLGLGPVIDAAARDAQQLGLSGNGQRTSRGDPCPPFSRRTMAAVRPRNPFRLPTGLLLAVQVIDDRLRIGGLLVPSFEQLVGVLHQLLPASGTWRWHR